MIVLVWLFLSKTQTQHTHGVDFKHTHTHVMLHRAILLQKNGGNRCIEEGTEICPCLASASEVSLKFVNKFNQRKMQHTHIIWCMIVRYSYIV